MFFALFVPHINAPVIGLVFADALGFVWRRRHHSSRSQSAVVSR
jgi:hypothetical protein